MRTPAHHLSKRFGCATARFHLAGRGELVDAVVGKEKIVRRNLVPAARGSRRLALGCVCLLRSGGWGSHPGLPCGSLRVGACGGSAARGSQLRGGANRSYRMARVAGSGGCPAGRPCRVWRSQVKEHLDRSTCGRDGSGAGILGNILGPGKVRTLALVGRHTNVTGTAHCLPLLL